MASKLADLARKVILRLTKGTRWFRELCTRSLFLEVGLTGHVLILDKEIAAVNNFKPLNQFEQWLLEPAIKKERKRLQEAFRQAVLKVTGKDPQADWN